MLRFKRHPTLAPHVGTERPGLPNAYFLNVFRCRKRQTQVTCDWRRNVVEPVIRGWRRGARGCPGPNQTIDLRGQSLLLPP